MNTILSAITILTITVSSSSCDLFCPTTIVKSVDKNCLYKIENLTNLVTGTCADKYDISQDMCGGYLPIGEHAMRFTESYQFGTCDTNVEVVDNTPPSIVSILPSTHTFTATGKTSEVTFAFNKYDNCCGKVSCNMTFVSYEDTELENCNENRDDCKCDGKISTLTFRNDGDELKYVVTNKDGDEMFSAIVANGKEFTVNPLSGNDDFGTKIFINGVELHTSCSQDIYITMKVGDLVITYGER